jgi:hypothetical protein
MVALGQGVRLAWSDPPSHVRSAVAGLAGGPGAVVGSAEPCAGGFSPGAAVRVTLADGRRAFAKAVSVAQNPDTPRMYRREAAVNAWLPRHPAIPALRGTYDDGTWVALVFDDVPAVPPSLPWSRTDLDLVLSALASVQSAAGRVDGVAVPVGEQYADDFASWRAIAASPPEGLDPWSLAHAERCAEAEASWASYAEGADLLHTDLRADNLLVGGGRAWLVDWPWACAGAAWVDAVLMAPSVALQGGPPPEELMAVAHPSAPPAGVTAVVAALAGFFTLAALRPAPPGLPTVREHQAVSGRETRAWLARLLDG